MTRQTETLLSENDEKKFGKQKKKTLGGTRNLAILMKPGKKNK